MAKKNGTAGTLLMALEVGASWPTVLHSIKNSEANFQAVVQDSGETADHFAGRALQRWYRLLDTTAPPHRFVLGTRVDPDERVVAARQRLARGVFDKIVRPNMSEFILWGSHAKSGEEQGRLLELAGALVADESGSGRLVRVLFGDSTPSFMRDLNRPTTESYKGTG